MVVVVVQSVYYEGRGTSASLHSDSIKQEKKRKKVGSRRGGKKEEIQYL